MILTIILKFKKKKKIVEATEKLHTEQAHVKKLYLIYIQYETILPNNLTH